MLELRLRPDAKRVAAMRLTIARECRRTSSDPAHADTVALLAAQLVGERASDVLVIVTPHSDVTTLMVRANGAGAELGPERRRMLEEHTSRWSTMSGRDGRTILAEIPRSPEDRAG